MLIKTTKEVIKKGVEVGEIAQHDRIYFCDSTPRARRYIDVDDMRQWLKEEIHRSGASYQMLEEFDKSLSKTQANPEDLSANNDFTAHSDSPKSAHNFYYECPDCGYVTEEEPTKDKDTTKHNCSPTS